MDHTSKARMIRDLLIHAATLAEAIANATREASIAAEKPASDAADHAVGILLPEMDKTAAMSNLLTSALTVHRMGAI